MTRGLCAGPEQRLCRSSGHMPALAGTLPLCATLPGTQTTIYEGLGDCL